VNLTNSSNLRRTRDLNPLIDFVAKYSKFAYLAKLVVTTTTRTDTEGRPTCAGQAHRQNPRLTETDVSAPSLVEVGLNADASYPRTQRLSRLMPELRFANWREEFVAVLAHELRHIDQFWTGSHTQGQELEAEVDAETFAAAVLNAFRSSAKPRALGTRRTA
jgi:hypothetical protein